MPELPSEETRLVLTALKAIADRLDTVIGYIAHPLIETPSPAERICDRLDALIALEQKVFDYVVQHGKEVDCRWAEQIKKADEEREFHRERVEEMRALERGYRLVVKPEAGETKSLVDQASAAIKAIQEIAACPNSDTEPAS